MINHGVQTEIVLPQLKDSELFRRAIELRDAIDQCPDTAGLNPADAGYMQTTLDLLEAELVKRGLGDLYVRSLIIGPQHQSEGARAPFA